MTRTRPPSRRVTAILVVALVLLLAGCGLGREDSTKRSRFFGANGVSLFNFPPELWGRHLDAMAATGIGTVRVVATWEGVEKLPPRGGVHRYDWHHLDAIAGELAKRRLRWLPIMGFSAPWAASVPGDRFSAPRHDAQFATYVEAFVRRYGRNGEFWRVNPELPEHPVVSLEIWNEPDLVMFWRPQPDPVRYVDLYLSARAAAVQADGTMQTEIGGLASDTGPAFLRAMYRARPNLRGQVDAVSIHPYAPQPRLVLERIAAFRRTLDDLGQRDVPLDVTEVGWPTRGPAGFSRTDPERARFLAEVADRLGRSSCGVRLFIPHEWTSGMLDTTDVNEWFGLYRPDGEPTAAGSSYADVIRRLDPVRSQRGGIHPCPVR